MEEHSTATSQFMPPIDGPHLRRYFDAHAPALTLYARQWGHAPEDAVQEAFIALARQPEVPPEPVAWLYRTVRNAAISAARSHDRRRRRERTVAANRPAWFIASDSESRQEENLQVAAALADLPLPQREVVVARIWGGLTFQQIAAITESSTSTAHRNYETALAALRNQLEGIRP